MHPCTITYIHRKTNTGIDVNYNKLKSDESIMIGYSYHMAKSSKQVGNMHLHELLPVFAAINMPNLTDGEIIKERKIRKLCCAFVRHAAP